jgi:Zn finger protein HypA/HybF involved in hydrogenase expression
MIEISDIEICRECGVCYHKDLVKKIDEDGMKYNICPVCKEKNFIITDELQD